MKLGRVVGTVVSTAKEPTLEGRKLLVVMLLDLEARETGGYVVAVDSVGAGVGEVVLVATGSSARMTEATRDRPSDAVIMAIVDSWDVEDVVKWRKADAR
ncbi:MAG: EutN/CcmL family microcompartment protein [Candidatus Hydrogenedentes bacterium]|nr:EutN/CcmL family microcompartment protein [Candidatus Hydrogenedentota bacterium]